MAPYTLPFTHRYDYDAGKSGITLEVELSANGKEARLLAKLDTGAQNCIFNRLHGELIGLDIERGTPLHFSTATGSFRAFGHRTSLRVLGLEVDIEAYFAEDPNFPRDVLGRYGLLQQFRLGLIDYEGLLYLAHYSA